MALLRNREVTVLGPNGTVTSPIFTVLYPDGSREDVELRYIHMTEAEKKEFEKTNASFVGQVRTVDDKRLQQVRDDQDAKKIREAQKKNTDGTVEVPLTSVKLDRSQIDRAGLVTKGEADARVRDATTNTNTVARQTTAPATQVRK